MDKYHKSYKPEYCGLIIELMKEGSTSSAFTAELMITKRTYYDWQDKNPEFKEACELAFEMSKQWWLNYGYENRDNPDFNHQYYNLQMGSRFGMSSRHRTKRAQDVVGSRRKVKKGAKLSALDQFNHAVHSYEDGEIGAEELKVLTKSFNEIADLKEKAELVKIVEELEKRADAAD